MPNIIDYLRQYGSKSLRDLPLNEVDCLLLSEIAYSDFPENETLLFGDALLRAAELPWGERRSQNGIEKSWSSCARRRKARVLEKCDFWISPRNTPCNRSANLRDTPFAQILKPS